MQPGTKSASRPVDKPVVNRRFFSSVGLHKIIFFRASEKASTTVFFDSPEGQMVGSFLGEPTRRRPVLPGPGLPAAPPCAQPQVLWLCIEATLRPDPPVVCPGFRFDRFQLRTRIIHGMCGNMIGSTINNFENLFQIHLNFFHHAASNNQSNFHDHFQNTKLI